LAVLIVIPAFGGHGSPSFLVVVVLFFVVFDFTLQAGFYTI